ncbi:MAG: hypothetical protein QXS85_01595 [Acidilobaceae archaeon]
MDVKAREVPPLYWALAIAIATPITLYSYTILNIGLAVIAVNVLLSLSLTLLVYVLYRECVMGGADVLALLFLSLSSPVFPDSFMPGPFLAVLYAVVPVLVYHIYSVRLVCRDIRCLLRLEFEIPAWRLMEDSRLRWWIVLSGSEEYCEVEEDAPQAAARISGGNPNAILRATPGHPYIAHLAVGYTMACIIGDYPLEALIAALVEPARLAG